MDKMPEEDEVSPVSTAPATPTSPLEFKMLPLFMDFEDFVSPIPIIYLQVY